MNNLNGLTKFVNAILCLLLCETSWAEPERKWETFGGIEWKYTISGGGAELGWDDYWCAIPQSTSGHVDIPAKLGGLPVTRIGASAFEYCQYITSVTIPDSVKEVGNSAFRDCYSLSSVIIPESVSHIGDYAFWHCGALISIKLPQSIKSIGEGALGCGIRHLDLPSKDIQLGKCCFMNSGLRDLPTNLSMIPERAFDSCHNLTSIVIPSTVKEIGDAAFADSYVTDVVISHGVEKIGAGAFACNLGGTYLKSVKIPSSVKVIGGNAFVLCRKLVSVNIPEGVEVIGACAFSQCSSLSEICIPQSVTSIGSDVFFYCTKLADVVINAKVDSLKGGTFAYCTSMRSVTLPETLRSVDNSGSWGPFVGCWLEDVYFQGGVPAVSGDFPGSKGHYVREYADEWQKVIDPHTKMWHGLKMSAPTYRIIYNSNGGVGSAERQECEFGSDGVQVDDGGNLHWEGHCFMGWAFAPDGEVAYKAGDYVKEPTESETVTLYAKWSDCVVHFNANGGVFRGKDGREVKEFDQYFVYGEPQKLFTDDLVPMRMDGSGNQFLGWVRGTPEITSSDDLIDSGKVWTWNDGVTEETLYAVWTTTLKVLFYNNDDKWNASLLPTSLADHLTWSVEGESRTYKSGESIAVEPGTRKIKLQVDGDYVWIAGVFDLGDDNPNFNAGQSVLALNLSNDFTDQLLWKTPKESLREVYVKVSPRDVDDGLVCFSCRPAIRESLRDRIKASDVPFTESKVSIAIEGTGFNESGVLVPAPAHALTGLKPDEVYPLPKGVYRIKSVAYDADQSSGDPYWEAVVGVNQTFEVGAIQKTSPTESIDHVDIDFDMFGGDHAVMVELDPQGGKCAKSRMWFTNPWGAEAYGGSARIDKDLPRPLKAGFESEGWFTAKSGGKKMEFGDAITDCTLYAHWKTKVTEDWLLLFPELAARAQGDVEAAASLTAANGCRTVGECYELGINPEDSNDDFKITGFELKDGKPVIQLNHTKDGSGNSFESRIKTLGKARLSDVDWVEATDINQSELRFFKAMVDLP